MYIKNVRLFYAKKKGKTMKKKFVLVGMLVAVLAFGMTVVSCEDESKDEPVEEVYTTPLPLTPPITTPDFKNGTVSIKALNTTHRAITMDTAAGPGTFHFYTIEVQLELSNGFWQWASADNSIVRPKAQSWVTSTGIPSEFGYDGSDVNGYGETTIIYLRWSRSGLSSPLTALSVTTAVTTAIDQTKLSEMKGYTNLTDSLTLGTPSTAISTAWVDKN